MQSHSASAFALKMEQTAVLEDGVTQSKEQPESYCSIQYILTPPVSTARVAGTTRVRISSTGYHW
jgi:hypothetical protein